MTTSLPLTELETGPSAKWSKIGDQYSGRITNIDKRQQTDPKDGSPKTFKSGDPMPVYLFTLEQADGDTVVLWASGGGWKAVEGSGQAMLQAIGTAAKAAGSQTIEVGAELAVAFTGLADPPGRGLNAPRLFTAQYRPPSKSVPVDLFSDQGA